ncbi:MAG: choice-of-anchor Q domain-containing protein [Candidatus Binatia bacterium]
MSDRLMDYRRPRSLRLFVVVAAAGGLAFALPPGRLAHAAEITVTSASGASGGPGCTLRDAITAANTDVATGGCPAGSGADTIILTAGAMYTLTEVDNATVHDGVPLPNGLPSVTSEITITGNGVTIARSSGDGTPAFRLLHVAAGGHLTLNALTLTNGKLPIAPDAIGEPTLVGNGGAIFNEGALLLTNAAVTANGGGSGGGVYNAAGATLTLIDSTVSGNHAGLANGDSGDGAGIYNAGVLTLLRTVVTGNQGGESENIGGAGGGIANVGTATLTDSTVANNRAGGAGNGGAGGGLFNSGALTLTRCTVSGNQAGEGDIGGNGGGIANGDGESVFFSARTGGTLTLIDSTVSGNIAGGGGCDGGNGGGIFNTGTLTLTDCTVSGNQVGGATCVAGDGGGIFNGGTLLLASCTISGNSGWCGWGGFCEDGKGGGIASAGPLAVVRNTLVAGNSTAASGRDCHGVVTSQGYNLIQDIADCTISGDTTGNITNVDPHLGPLQSNGGLTETQALFSGSPAIDAGNPSGCADADGNVLTIDQRGAPRAVNGDARCDIGAYEASWPAWPTITPTPTPTPTTTPTPTPPTPTPIPTPVQCGQGTTCLWVGSATGAPGARVTFAVTLLPEGLSIAATQNDISFAPMTTVAANADGTPDCAVNPLINKNLTAFAAFLPHGCSPGVDCQAIRAIVLSLGVQEALDDAVLYRCAVDIAGDAAPGRYPLMNSNALAADPFANPKQLNAVSGEIVVEAPPAPAAAASQSGMAASAAGGGCSMGPAQTDRGTALVLLALPVALFVRKRRQGLG